MSIEREIVALAEATYGNARYGETDVITADAKEWESLITPMLLPVRECVKAWGEIISQPDWFERARDDRQLFDAVVEAVGRTQTALVVLKGGIE